MKALLLAHALHKIVNNYKKNGRYINATDIIHVATLRVHSRGMQSLNMQSVLIYVLHILEKCINA